MNIIKLILHTDLGSNFNNLAFLGFRFLFAFELLRVHGLKKFGKGNHGPKEHIPNPFNLPDRLNQFIATFSDTAVPFLIMMGVCTRLFIIPTIGVTSIGYFIVHKNDTPEGKDIPYIYTLIGLLILLIGPGSYSLDFYLYNLIN